MKIINPSTSGKPVMNKLPNLFGALVIMDIFQMTLKFSLFTVDFLCNFCFGIVNKFLCLIPKLAIVVFGVHYEPLNSN